jgi:hypothetical protein
LNQSIAAAQSSLSAFTGEPPLNPLSITGHRLPPAEPVVRPVLPAANDTLAAPLTATRKHKKVNVTLCLMNGERIAVEAFDDEDAARARARELTRELGASGEWQLIGARFVRPEAVVTVDMESARN